MSKQLQIVAKPCGGGTCPTIYKDAEGRFFLQGNRLAADDKQSIAIAEHEEVVEISPTLLEALRNL